MLPTHIEYHSVDLYDTYTIYNPADIHWDVLNDMMSSYYLHIQCIFGLNGMINLQYLHPYTTYNLQVHSGLDQFEPVLKIAGHSGPLTRPSVQLFPGHKPWTEPRSGLAVFRFKP
jgi:hypothetical protein